MTVESQDLFPKKNPNHKKTPPTKQATAIIPDRSEDRVTGRKTPHSTTAFIDRVTFKILRVKADDMLMQLRLQKTTAARFSTPSPSPPLTRTNTKGGAKVQLSVWRTPLKPAPVNCRVISYSEEKMYEKQLKAKAVMRSIKKKHSK